jgi:putative ABC transport system substrate-binding protein
MNNRRKLLVALGMGALAAPFASFAQQQGKVWRVGFFYLGSRKSALDTRRLGAFLDGLRELGYVSGTNLILEERYADSEVDRLPGLAAELVRLKVDVVVATGGPVYRALQQETHTIPIVTTVMPDPVGDGYAKSMARPGGNFTGLTISATDLGPKLLELVRATVPKMTRVGVMVHPDNVTHPPQLILIMSAAQKAGMHVILAQAGTVQEIDRELAMLARERIGAVIIMNDVFFVEQMQHLAAQALKYKLPSISQIYGYAEAGGLMSYGSDTSDNFRRAATYVDKILKGAKPGDIPFEQPTRYYFVINGRTAKAFGIKPTRELLMRADKVIE